jgi:ADP-ribosylglycohydrolase
MIRVLGAIIGDIIGVPYEFHNIKKVDFPLFCSKSTFSDDTVLTIAVAEALMEGHGDEAATERAMVTSIRKYGKMFPDAGYGGRFNMWLNLENTEPYGSFGNGSAMRVSPVGWFFDDIETVEKFAEISARVTHNHPEGIKGAKSVAGAIFLARAGADKEEIKAYVSGNYQYDLDRTLDEIRPFYRFNETCQGSVPEAFIAFLESESFEDAVRKAVSIGGDSDTIAAIAGSVAEAHYGIPDEIKKQALSRLDDALKNVLVKWRSLYKEKS